MRNQTVHPLIQTSLLSLSLARALKTAAILLSIVAASRTRTRKQARSNSPDATPESAASMQQRISALETEVAELKAAVHQLQATAPAPVSQPRLLLASAAITTPAITTPAPTPAPEPLAAADQSPSKQRPPPFKLQRSNPSHQPPKPCSNPTTPSSSPSSTPPPSTSPSTATTTTTSTPPSAASISSAPTTSSATSSASIKPTSSSIIPPIVADGRRWGGRLDLQFGQATDTLQGNPNNEPRPDIYRNILPGLRHLHRARRQRPRNRFRKMGQLARHRRQLHQRSNELLALVLLRLPALLSHGRSREPARSATNSPSTIGSSTAPIRSKPPTASKTNSSASSTSPQKQSPGPQTIISARNIPIAIVSEIPTNPIPVQPVLNFIAIRPAPNGRTHIFDNYVTWQPTPKLNIAVEGDYFIQRLWLDQAPGESAAPSHVIGGAAYLQYQFTPRISFATRAEYLSDRGGLFSGITQALKENTVTFDYKLGDGFLMRYEWRRDYSNQPSFLSDTQGVLLKQQTTATVGLLWWWGRKEGTW